MAKLHARPSLQYRYEHYDGTSLLIVVPDLPSPSPAIEDRP
jgi:hypothetical protein